MNNAYTDKADAKGEQLQARMAELQANLKEATADARIAIEKQIEELKRKLQG